jgi:F-type H+-transporting ATPase subunit gamma
VLIAGDRGLSGSFNSQIIRQGLRRFDELKEEGKEVTLYAVGRRIDGSLNFRNLTVQAAYTGFTDRPAFSDARNIAEELMADYIDEKIDSVEIVYNSYISPLQQIVTSQRVLPLQQAEIFEGGLAEPTSDEAVSGDDSEESANKLPPLWLYEPEPEELLKRLIPDFVEITIFRALLESAASEMGAKMTAMQSASDNASDMIKNLTLEMNRQRQAAITQEILEVVGGAEGV